MVDAKAFRFELQNPCVALGKGRLDLFSGEAGAFGARVQERANPLHEVEVVGGHDESIMSRGSP